MLTLLFSPRAGRLLLTLLFLVATGCLGADDKAAPSKKEAKEHAGDELFNQLVVLKMRIQVPDAEMKILRRSGWGGHGNNDRPTAKVTVFEGGKAYTNVAMHLKGAAGSFRSVDDNPAVTLIFDKFVEGQTFHGLKKISLNNSVQDPSFISEKICRELFAASGIPVPRAGYSMLELNGRDLGLRVMLEGWNKQFLKRHFKNADGNLYDCGFVKDIDARLSVNSGEKPDDQRDLQKLVKASLTAPDKRLAEMEKVLDIDKFLTYLAMDVIQCNWDGYALNLNNYRVFHDLDSDKMIFMPHGLDQMFGVMQASPDFPIVPNFRGLVARSLMAIPSVHARYLDKMAYLSTNVFSAEKATNRIAQIAAAIRPAIAERSGHSATYFDQHVKWLSKRVNDRDRSLHQQIATIAKPASFDKDGYVELTPWRSKIYQGFLTFSKSNSPEGQQIFSATSNQGGGVGSYRTQVLLPKGHYRFEGDIKLEDVKSNPDDPKAAGLACGFPAECCRSGSPARRIGPTTCTNLTWKNPRWRSSWSANCARFPAKSALPPNP